MNQKICSSCGKCLPLDQFSMDKRKPDGRCTKCKECFHAYYEANSTKIKERVQEYREANIVSISEAAKRRYRANPEPIRKRSAANHKANRPKRLERMKRYAANHALEFYERNTAWRQHNQEYSNLYKKTRLDNDPEKRKRQNTSNREWAHRNPAIVRRGTLNRATRETLARDHYTLSQWQQLLEACNNQCLCCKIAAKDTPEGHLEKDHVISFATIPTGTYTALTRQQSEIDLISNIQPLCKNCNRRKAKKTTDYRSVKLRRQLAELFGNSGFALDEVSLDRQSSLQFNVADRPPARYARRLRRWGSGVKNTWRTPELRVSEFPRLMRWRIMDRQHSESGAERREKEKTPSCPLSYGF